MIFYVCVYALRKSRTVMHLVRFVNNAKPVPFRFSSLVICYPFVFLSTSVQNPCAISVLYESVFIFIPSFHVAVYDFYSLLKSVHVGQQFPCGRKKDSESYRSDTDSLQCSKLRPDTGQFPVKLCMCLDIIKFDRPKCPCKVPWCLASVRYRLAILHHHL